MKNKKKNPPPLILYEKYKHDNRLDKSEEIKSGNQSKQNFVKKMLSMIELLILIGMMLLSMVGVITLINPEMKMMLIKVLGG